MVAMGDDAPEVRSPAAAVLARHGSRAAISEHMKVAAADDTSDEEWCKESAPMASGFVVTEHIVLNGSGCENELQLELSSKSRSGYVGVHKIKGGLFAAQIYDGRTTINVDRFANAEDAARGVALAKQQFKQRQLVHQQPKERP